MDEIKIYKQGNLTFIITPQRIVIRTNLGQQFYLQPKVHFWNRRLKLIQAMIELDEIRDLNELASWCASGNIEWATTDRNYKMYETEKIM